MCYYTTVYDVELTHGWMAKKMRHCIHFLFLTNTFSISIDSLNMTQIECKTFIHSVFYISHQDRAYQTKYS